jgi:CRISPR-associated protein Csx17
VSLTGGQVTEPAIADTSEAATVHVKAAPTSEPELPVHDVRLLGCRSRPLVHYLKSLGLLRVISRQADPNARVRWSRGELILRSTLDARALSAFLLERYAPTPVVSPWNGGSGFFPKDNKKAFEAIENSTGERLAAFRGAIGNARAVLVESGLTEKPTGNDTVKLDLVRRLRARLDDEALEWLDAAIVLLGRGRSFPPLLGSGGNDGRFDFANNYAQAVVACTAIDGDEKTEQLSRQRLANSLHRDPVELQKMSIGHFWRDSSPVNSPMGESDGLGNPWDLVLAVEGCCLLAAGAARRHWTDAAGSLVAPFTARITAAGYGSAVTGESGRAELWLPLWSSWVSLPELSTLIREARAQVGRRHARSGLDFVRAAGELGVARGIDNFERYALLERAGQSTLSVPVGRIAVRERPHVRTLHTLDRWLPRIQAYGNGDCPRAHAEALARLDSRLFEFADKGTAQAGCGVLEALGELESLLAASRAGAHANRELTPLIGANIEPWLRAADDGTHEFAVAVALATLHDPSSSKLPTMREYLHGTGRDEHGRPNYSPGISRVVARRANPIVRLGQLHTRRHVAVTRHEREHFRPEVLGQGGTTSRPQLAFPHGIACPLASARAFVRAELDERRIMKLAAGLAVLRPSWPKVDGRLWRPRAGDRFGTPVPAFDALALAFAGTYRARPDAEAGHPSPADAVASLDLEPRGIPLQPRLGWVAQLAASPIEHAGAHDTGHVRLVIGDALMRLRMAGLTPLVEGADLLADTPPGPYLAAALLLRLPGRDRDAIAASLTTAVRPRPSTSVPHGLPEGDAR